MVKAYQQACRLSADLGLSLSNGQVEVLADHMELMDIEGEVARGTEAKRLALAGGPAVRRILGSDPLDRAIERLSR